MAAAPARRPPLANRAYSRDSNLLRASVLDVAMELGIGTSRTVENWMFNAVEEEEEETVVSPGLTSGSTATSEESAQSPYPLLQNGIPARQPPYVQVHTPSLSLPDDPHRNSPSSETASPLSANPSPKHNKLRKSRKDGNESDGGYISDAGKKKSKSKGDETEYETDKDSGKDKKKSKKKSKKASSKDDAPGSSTDTFFKSPSKSPSRFSRKAPSTPDGGDVSDGGYLSEASVSKKKKSSFFRLGSKSSSTSLRKSSSNTSLAAEARVIPPVPALPALPSMALPIAERFARSTDDGSRSSSPMSAATWTTDGNKGSVSSLSQVFPSPVHRALTPTPTKPLERSPPSSEPNSPEALNSSLPLPSAGRRQGVRFTPSTRFSPSDDRPFIPPPSPHFVPPSRETTQRPQISLPMTSAMRDTSSSLTATSDGTLPARSRGPRKVPSPLPLSPSPLPGMSPSPVPSDYSLISSSDFIVPSPAHRLSPMPSPRRNHFLDLPPPTPPPQGPLPQIPHVSDSSRFRTPTATSHSASPNPSAALGLFSQPVPTIQRGRELPFPPRPLLPAEESSNLVQMGRSQRGLREGSWERDVQPRGPEPRGADLDDVRPDVAQFFFSTTDDTTASRGVPAYPEVDDADDTYDPYADERSLYPESEAHTLETHRPRGEVESFYFDEAGQRASMWSSRASLIDDERSREIRARFIERVDAMYGAEEAVPPVPKLRF
ncbi:hypothetical protein BV25DRAFT_1829190 [Artomyces pyxidatus]|uniref:Uncharacterized protein n=1 Tax=Artomyces pyxidatus TaxID=48021 RepID=A0ACB8SSP2_9AGAM|nr:hypothetical protein BV25DRAFT_1829190 [Artomyces pyxidatus]